KHWLGAMSKRLKSCKLLFHYSKIGLKHLDNLMRAERRRVRILLDDSGRALRYNRYHIRYRKEWMR
ncbi:hypothetical protein, partial [Mitsuokella jalaludinii]|uniref:hypothetical protein n=1 Tax=Mitsuokella jalaludinii TaxID=187979 RepID=UPI0030782FF0